MARAAGADGKRGCRRKQHRGRLGVGAGARAEHRLVAMASATTRSTSVARRPSAGRRQAERLSLRRRRCERAVQRPARGLGANQVAGAGGDAAMQVRERLAAPHHRRSLPVTDCFARAVGKPQAGASDRSHRRAVVQCRAEVAARVGARAQVVRRRHRRLFGLGRVFLQKLRYTDGIINGVGGACSFASYLQQLPTRPLFSCIIQNSKKKFGTCMET